MPKKGLSLKSRYQCFFFISSGHLVIIKLRRVNICLMNFVGFQEISAWNILRNTFAGKWFEKVILRKSLRYGIKNDQESKNI